MAVEGGFSEPLSRAQFPANREFREFGRLHSEEDRSIAMDIEALHPHNPI
jgi:hypothetical protein